MRLHALRIPGSQVPGRDCVFVEFQRAPAHRRLDRRQSDRHCGHRIAEIRPWLSELIKTFRLTQYTILSLCVDVPPGCSALAGRYSLEDHRRGGAHRARDPIDVRGGRISSHIEFFVPI
jgi:hypothetical protein